MKPVTTFILAIIFTFTAVFKVGAQSAETIWLTANTTAYKTGETVLVTVNAVSGTPVQGFTFQIRYDPACLQPVNATSPISGMNGLQLPQTTGSGGCILCQHHASNCQWHISRGAIRYPWGLSDQPHA